MDIFVLDKLIIGFIAKLSGEQLYKICFSLLISTFWWSGTKKGRERYEK